MEIFEVFLVGRALKNKKNFTCRLNKIAIDCVDIIKNNIWLALIKTCAYSSSFLGWLTMSTSTEREEYKIFSQSLGCVCQTIWMVAQNSRSLFHAEILACKEILVHHIITIIIFSFFKGTISCV